MRRFLFLLFLSGFILLVSSFVEAQTPEEEIRLLKEQVQQLMRRIEQLEQQQAKQKEEFEKQKEEVAKKIEPSVALANVASKLKIKGRYAAGFYDSGKSGSYPSGSFEAPEGKIQFAFEPDKINTVIMRFNLNNATAQTPLLDYFYLQSKDFLPFLKDTPFSLNSRLGRFKFGFGEETWSDNPVEGVLPSNSAPKAGGNDEGLELAGKIKLDKLGLKGLKPLGWVTSISDGNSGVGSDSSSSKAFMGKLYYTPIEPLYLSATYYDSGSLKASNSELSIAGLTTRPTGAINWQRTAWEVDARYDFGKGKKPLDPPAFSDSKAFIRLSYGEFQDDASGANERSGDFGFAEGTYNLTKKFYTAGRFSFVDLDGDVTASLNSVTANKYERYSLGLGYRWSENTILKLSYDWNDESGPSTEESDNDLLSAIVATQF